MANNQFTGSETQRFSEIHNRWLVFEPVSNHEYSLNNYLYTVPLGQTKKPELEIFTGSVQSASGTITIEKDIHFFDNESEAVEFITDTGPDSISFYKETRISDKINGEKLLFEVHVINYPIINVDLGFLEARPKKGFVVEPFRSGSIFDEETVTLEPVTREIKIDKQNRLVSDTYLRFFAITTDKTEKKESTLKPAEFSEDRLTVRQDGPL